MLGLFRKAKPDPRLELTVAKKKINDSRLALIKYFEQVIDGNNNREIERDLETLKNVVVDFKPCSDERAIKLDEQIEFIVQKFCDGKVEFEDYLKKDDESTAMARQYDIANKEIFEKISTVLQTHLASRSHLMSSPVKTAEELNKLSAFRRQAYENRMKKLENIERQWEIDMVVLDFTIESRKLFHERQILEQRHGELHKKLMTDKSNRDSIAAQLEQLDKEIARITRHEQILAKNIIQNKDLAGMMKDADLVRFAKDARYCGAEFAKVYEKTAAEAKKLLKDMEEEDDMIGEVERDYVESTQKAVPQTTAAKSKYLLEAEEYDMNQSPATGEQQGPPAAGKTPGGPKKS